MRETVKIIGPCSKYIDGQGWTTEVPVDKLEELGFIKLGEDDTVLSKNEYERLKRVEKEKDRLYEIKLDLENQIIEKGWTDYVGADEIERQAVKRFLAKLKKECLDGGIWPAFINRVAEKLQKQLKEGGE